MDHLEWKRLHDSAAAGNWEACYQIAEHFYERRDYSQALSWYQKAAELPECNPLVYFEIGYLFQHGEGTKSDLIEAAQWYQKAAENDVPQAFYNLAMFYQNGIVVDRDPVKAVEMLETATALMRRLQIERYSYDTWKEGYERQYSCLQTENTARQTKITELSELSRQLRQENSDLARDTQRLEAAWKESELARTGAEDRYAALRQEAAEREEALFTEKTQRESAERFLAEYRAETEQRRQAGELLLQNLVQDHRSSCEKVQSAYEEQINKLHAAYNGELSSLRMKYDELCLRTTRQEQAISSQNREISEAKYHASLLESKLRTKSLVVNILAAATLFFAGLAVFLIAGL